MTTITVQPKMNAHVINYREGNTTVQTHVKRYIDGIAFIQLIIHWDRQRDDGRVVCEVFESFLDHMN